MTKIILTLGIPRSGSTWLFNIIRAILKHSGKSFSHGFAENFGVFNEIFDPNLDFCLIKAHKLDRETLERCYQEGCSVVATVRSVGDSVASQWDMFGAGVVQGCQVILETLACLDELSARDPKILVYESGFFNKLQTIKDICALLELDLSDAVCADILDKHLASSVKAAIIKLSEGDELHESEFDENSHWYKDHVKDGAVGKFASKLNDGELMFIRNIFPSVDNAVYKFPDYFCYDGRGVSSLERNCYKYASTNGERFRVELGPIATFPAGQYDIDVLNNSAADLLDLDPVVGLLAEDELVSLQPLSRTVTRFKLSVPLTNRLKPHYLRVDIISRGWVPLSSMLADFVTVRRI